jgi:hypothetical protein
MSDDDCGILRIEELLKRLVHETAAEQPVATNKRTNMVTDSPVVVVSGGPSAPCRHNNVECVEIMSGWRTIPGG